MKWQAVLAGCLLSLAAFGQDLTVSNLPIVVINTNNETIPDEPKIMASMGIIYNGPGLKNNINDTPNHYNGKIGIEVRGSSSQSFPKLSYGFETWTESGKSVDVSLLGMPRESDWILSANYSDKSLMNNVLTYYLANSMGYYASRTQYVELVLNGEYQGIYVLMEKIKKDQNRVNIADLDVEDISGADVTGGYILKIDKFTGSSGTDGFYSKFLPAVSRNDQRIFFQYEYPSEKKIQPDQKEYIERFVDSFEYALKFSPLYDTVVGWRRFADEYSFIHYFLLNELSKNVDGYRISTFLHKKKVNDGNKLVAGPVWDYDLAYGNAEFCGGWVDTGWAFRYGDICAMDTYQVPFWWERLLEDTLFCHRLKQTYSEYRIDLLSARNLLAWIDSVANLLNDAQERNFAKWPILDTYVWPNPYPIPSSYEGEIDELKNWLIDRLAWLDIHIPQAGSPVPTPAPDPRRVAGCSAYPNPFSSQLNFRLSSPTADRGEVQLVAMDGQLMQTSVFQLSPGTRSYTFRTMDGLASGMYLLRVKTSQHTHTCRVMHEG